jgi:hypothetical protein
VCLCASILVRTQFWDVMQLSLRLQMLPVPLVGPDEHREDLDRGEGEGRGADAPVKGVGDAPTRCRG